MSAACKSAVNSELAGDASSTVEILDLPEGCPHTKQTVSGCVTNESFSLGPRYLITIDKGNVARLWDSYPSFLGRTATAVLGRHNSLSRWLSPPMKEIFQVSYGSEVLTFDLTPDLDIVMADRMQLQRRSLAAFRQSPGRQGCA
jgi:hypothetical protein